MADILSLAPTILSFLGGPLGGLAGAGIEFLADKLGATDKTKESISNALVNADPIKLKQLDLDFQKFCLQNNLEIPLAQIKVNEVEAANTNWFVAGWRPFVGWVCGFGLAYSAIFEPIIRFVAKVGYNYQGVFPIIDTNITMQVLMGMLGLGAMRTFEKKTGTEGSR